MLPIPYQVPIYGGMQVGRQLLITGTPTGDRYLLLLDFVNLVHSLFHLIILENCQSRKCPHRSNLGCIGMNQNWHEAVAIIGMNQNI